VKKMLLETEYDVVCGMEHRGWNQFRTEMEHDVAE
jgi:hypothetical protein